MQNQKKYLPLADRDEESGLSTLAIDNIEKQKSYTIFEKIMGVFTSAPNILHGIQLFNTVTKGALADVAIKVEGSFLAAKITAAAGFIIPGVVDISLLHARQEHVRKLNKEFIEALACLAINSVIEYSHAKEKAIPAVFDAASLSNKTNAEKREMQAKLSAKMLTFLETKGSIKINIKGTEVVLFHDIFSTKVKIGLGLLSLGSAIAGAYFTVNYIGELEELKKQYGEKAKDHSPDISPVEMTAQIINTLPLVHLMQEIHKRLVTQESYLHTMMCKIIREIYVDTDNIHAIPTKVFDFLEHEMDPIVFKRNKKAIEEHQKAIKELEDKAQRDASRDKIVAAIDASKNALQGATVSAKDSINEKVTELGNTVISNLKELNSQIDETVSNTVRELIENETLQLHSDSSTSADETRSQSSSLKVGL